MTVRKSEKHLLAKLKELRQRPLPQPSKAPSVVPPELTPLEVLDALLEKSESVSVPQPERRVLFRTRRGLLLLRELNLGEVRRLATKSRITSEEIREWHSYQEGRHRGATPATNAWRLV